jgi:high-affinity iron transporter
MVLRTIDDCNENNYRSPMGQMVLVTLREGIEMFLIVAIAATYLRKTGRAALLSAVGWGTAFAVLVSVALGTWLAEKAVTPRWESVLALVAAVLVISMVIYMLKAAKHLRREIGAKLESAALRPGRAAWTGVFLFVVLMITREGMETAFITASLFRQTETAHFVLGAFAGLVLAAALAWMWMRYGQRVNLTLFFRVTSVFLVLFALQLLVYAFHEATEANALPLDNAYWHIATEPYGPEGPYGA